MPPTLRPTRAALAALLVAAAVGLGTGAAQGQGVDEARAARERARRERAEAAARLDALEASDDELEAAVAALDAEVAASEAEAADARRATEAARQEVAHAESAAVALEARASGLRQAAADAAIRLYTAPPPSPLAELVDMAGADLAGRRQALLQQVTGRQSDLVDALRAAEHDWQLERDRATGATLVAAQRQEQLEVELAEAAAARDVQARLEADLDRRIAEVHAEVDALAAEEASLTALIRRRQAEQAAAEAARQRAERSASRSVSGSAGSGSGPGAAAPGGTASSSGLAWPRPPRVNSEFGTRWGRLHAGIDLAGSTGDPISAAGSGTVIFAGTQNGYGGTVIIDHGGGLSTLYAHQSRLAVGDGQRVSRGQVIGYVGNTGSSTGSHLHFEVRVGGSPQNPRRHLP